MCACMLFVSAAPSSPNATSPALPYPLPEGWEIEPARREPWWRITLWTLVFGFGTLLAYVHLLENDYLAALGRIAFAAVFGAIAVGELWKWGGEHGAPEFINAVVLTRAERAPEDSWVHFFRDGRTPRAVIAGMLGVTIPLLAATAWAGVLIVRAGGGALWWLFAVAFMLLIGVIALFAMWAAAAVRRRVGSFGRRATGIAIGRSGITLHFLDDPSFIAWENVRAVTAGTSVKDQKTGDFVPELDLELENREDQWVPIGGYEAHAWLIYCALRFWAEHAELRHELSTTFAQQRILGWRAAMAAAR